MKNVKSLLAISALSLVTASAFAASHAGAPMAMDSKKEMAAPAGDTTEAEVRKVDMENKKITLKHGDIKNLDMPGMTMVFQVKDPAMLDKFKAGDKVRFKAEKSNGAIVVTDLQPSLAAGAALAQAATKPADAPMAMDNKKAMAAPAGDTTEAEVRKVDMENKKITLKHGDIKNLDMPGMTMVFQVKDPAMLDKVKAGDKVRFKAEKSNGAIVVTDLQPSK